MRTTVCALAVFVAFVLTSPAAFAQDFAKQGVFIVSADRLVGFTHSSQNVDPEGPGNTFDTAYDNFALLGQSEMTGGFTSPYSIPRVSFDYFVIDGLTIGGSLIFDTLSVNGDNNVGDYDATLFALAPRVGYAIMFSDAAGFWPRGGFTLYHLSEDVNNASETGFGFNLDFPFVFVPAEHTAILVGPALDLGLVGSGHWDVGFGGGNTDYDRQIIDFGIYAGLGIWF
jgi:hypothetical protein